MNCFLTTLFVAAGSMICLAKDGNAADVRYDATSKADVRGVVTEVHVVPEGKALPGVHVTLRSKTETVEVYLAPPEFLNLLKISIQVGDDLRAIGSRVNGAIILTKEFFKKGTSIILREDNGAPVWENWGVNAVPTSI